MIKIKRISKKECDEFGKERWNKLDVAHYGKKTEWKEKKFKFKAEENGKTLGVVSGKFESGIVYVGTIIIDEKSRGKGIGKKLMGKVEEFTKKMGGHKIWLNTGCGWRACDFYEELGYEVEGKLPNHYFHKDFVIYSKYL